MRRSFFAYVYNKGEQKLANTVRPYDLYYTNVGATFGRPPGFIALYRQIFKCKCRGWCPRQPDFVCSIILAISTQFFLDNLADQCYNKKAE